MSIPTEIAWRMMGAWERVLPVLKRDPDELAARLARRRLGFMTQPWRAYCLAVKANDNRIHPYRALFDPEHALNVRDSRHVGYMVEHTVMLDGPLVGWLTRPFTITPPGEPASRVARVIGASPSHVSNAIKAKGFRVHYRKGLGGHRGHPIPLIYRETPLDPGGERFWEMADRVFWEHPDYLSEREDEVTAQAVTRRPVYGPIGGAGFHFRGWRWVCPSCGEGCRVIFQPLPPERMNFQADLEKLLGKQLDCDQWERGLPCWACKRCHRVKTTSRLNVGLWGEVVALFSAGLLYGREVERPDWFDLGEMAVRKNPFVKRKREPRSAKRGEVLRLLVETDWPEKRIAREVRLHASGMAHHVRNIYRDYFVTDREGLRAKVREKRDLGVA